MLLPARPKVALTGGLDFNDHRLIWAKLDQVHAKHPDMVLLHGGSPKGAELIAAKWADNRKVPQIAFKPDWTRHAKAAPFKRNDEMLEMLPIGVLHFPGTGIQENLADKARKLGIPVWKFGGACCFLSLRSAARRRYWHMRRLQLARQAAGAVAPVACRGFAHASDTELPCGRERAYRCRSWSFSTLKP